MIFRVTKHWCVGRIKTKTKPKNMDENASLYIPLRKGFDGFKGGPDQSKGFKGEDDN